ncbi:uncharacterized protein A1O5_11452 [Cladophialophora psammophila CBS 110553]|uniref:Protein NO VEIN C-terminal domain-containing protein n=1 Tax=Cladophialophora psammophila CBS 110553 TaxID=1182543 RepID=W9W629_9EURO|nr:uncharacterized protein A1O5_11452 [Cladophialophora psammophila CBS 110553]EXJ63403.1 hypothetical protein A1O5_11452 [Cladophialophora psammophila CBS 110553]
MCGDETSARKEARNLVEGIKKHYGYLTGETLSRIPDLAVRAEVSNALKAKDSLIGSTIVTLAKNLYTSNARFVFELLQNADDNKYTKTHDMPFISFHVYPRKIVVECNEDGFTLENLKAICSVGKSTKTGAQGYIGEKGIGFKSVFMVAWKVLIHSGDFSFYFEHRKGDSGMGMISPTWNEPEQTLPDALTRVTLFLHDSGDAAFLASQREMISAQFHELQDTFLLFLKNIRKINLKFYDDDQNVTEEVVHFLENSARGSKATITMKTITADRSEQISRTYHVTRYICTGLEKNTNREYSTEEEVQKKYSESEIVLAFPLAPDSTPLVEAQDAFAFLPLRTAGFFFLIQADFVTEANRQDVITASPRNLGLLDGIAHAFVKAVREFCDHPTLTYQWMRYLPDPLNANFQPFWKRLVHKIQTLLESTPVLRSRNEGPLGLIKSLGILEPEGKDEDGNPLWDDIVPFCYLSPAYSFNDLEILRSYGLEVVYMEDLVDRAEADLKLPRSRMKTSKDEDWHSRAAKLLAYPFSEGWDGLKVEVKAMRLIPLQSGQWISANQGPTYYASSAGVRIPRDLGLNLIDPDAAANSARKILFDYLGATEASTDHVRNAIFERYRSSASAPNVNLQTSRKHLEYLYLTQKHESVVVPLAFSRIYVYSEGEEALFPGKVDVYKADNSDYGVKKLLKATPPGPKPGDGAPGLSVPILHRIYQEDIPESPPGHPLTWNGFLNKYLNIQLHPKLIRDPGNESASLTDITYYLQQHRPEVFLPAVRRLWLTEGRKIASTRSAVEEMRCMEVLCRGGRKMPLELTYLPTPSLERLQARYMADSEYFPFLELPLPPSDDAESNTWEFLCTHFGVDRDDELHFFVSILDSIVDANKSAETVTNSPRLYGVYSRIQAGLQGIYIPSFSSQVLMAFRELFEEKSAILIPEGRGQRAVWARPSQCLWDGPQDMQTKYPVKTLCQAFLTASGPGDSSLEQFFRTTLELPDCSWTHLVDELKHLKTSGCTDFDQVNSLYNLINELVGKTNVDDVQKLRESIEDDALIYVNVSGRHKWCKISECLWASTTTIRGRTTLNDHYEDLKDFFVTVLGVSELSLDMVLDELIEKGARQASVKEVKDTLRTLALLLSSNTSVASSRRILNSRVFPVRYSNGKVALRTSTTDFGIVDRQRLGELFARKATLLDFSLDEVRQLKPFFAWSGLENRYLSNMVKEISRVDGGEPDLITDRDRDICWKAGGLFRIAAHYNSPRVSENDRSLQDLFRNARVYETDGISSLLVLPQGGQELPVELERSELHIREDESGLRIYVPRNPRSQDFCYLSKLPPRLFEWMMTHFDTQIRENIEPEGVLVVTKILNAKLSSVNWILEEAGIMEIPGTAIIDDQVVAADPDPADHESGAEESEQDEDEEQAWPSDREDEGEEAEEQSQTVEASHDRGIRFTPTTSNEGSNTLISSTSTFVATTISAQSSHSRAISGVVYNHSRHRPAAAGSSTLSPSPRRIGDERTARRDATPDMVDMLALDEDAGYVALLDNVITKARTTLFPSIGSFDMSQLLDSLPLDSDVLADEYPLDACRFRSATQRERDNKVGAAGELFVFELLSNLDPALPGFSHENWQSTIRKYVRVHPRYGRMDDWLGRETADITYDDASGALTALLIDQGYLARDGWAGRRPMYYIEVKSTVGPCGRPFFMSKFQYQRMQNLSTTGREDSPSPPAAAAEAIYVIFRVFHVGRDVPGVRIYIDPEAMRRKGDLVFTAENWSVGPGRV